MPFRGISVDDEGSIIYDGKKFIVRNPKSKALKNFNPGDKPLIGLPEDHPSHPNNRKKSPRTIPPGLHVPPPATTQPPQREQRESRDLYVDPTIQEYEERQERRTTTAPAPPVIAEPPDIDEIKLGHAAEDHEFPIHPVDMEYHLAAQHNPLLHEVQLICQHEGIPPGLESHPDRILSLCAEHGIDEENDAEAREYLNNLLNGGPRQYKAGDPLNAAWEEAHEAYDPSVNESVNNEKTAIANYRSLIETTYGVSLTRATDLSSNTGRRADLWDLLRVRMIHVGLEMAAAALGDMVREIGYDWDDATAFRRIIGDDIELFLSNETSSQGALAKVEDRKITVFWNANPNADRNYYLLPNLLLHELGHVFNANAGIGNRDRPGSINATVGHPNTLAGMGAPYPTKLLTDDPNELVIHSQSLDLVNPLHYDLDLEYNDKLFDNASEFSQDQVQLLQQSWEYTTNEFTADAFLNWVYHRNTGGTIGFTDDAAGDDWREFMDLNMRTWIRNAVVYSALRENSNLPFFLEHNRIRGFVGMATVGNFSRGAIVRNEPSTAGENTSVVGTLTAGDEVAVIGQAKGDINGVLGDWTAVIFNGTQRWMASFLLALPENVPPSAEDEWLDFDGGFSRAKDWQFYFNLLRYLDTGAGNA